MKKSNKEFITEFLNQVDSGKLVQVIKGLLSEDISEPIIESVEYIEVPQDNPKEDTIVVVDKLDIIDDKLKTSDVEEDFEKWIVANAKKHLEPPQPLEVPIIEDLYEKYFGENRLSPAQLIVEQIKNETDLNKVKDLTYKLQLAYQVELDNKEFFQKVTKNSSKFNIAQINTGMKAAKSCRPFLHPDRSWEKDKVYFEDTKEDIQELISKVETKNRELTSESDETLLSDRYQD